MRMLLSTLQSRCSALRRGTSLLAAALISALAANAATASESPAAPLMSVPQQIRDLYYGDALFYFFQEKYFDSLVRIDAALTLGRIEHHQTEAQLVRGALYLSLGEHVEAGKI